MTTATVGQPQRRAPLERGAIRGGGRSSGWSRSLNEGLLWKEERCGVEASPSSLGLASTKGSSGKRSDKDGTKMGVGCPEPQRRAPLERGAIWDLVVHAWPLVQPQRRAPLERGAIPAGGPDGRDGQPASTKGSSGKRSDLGVRDKIVSLSEPQRRAPLERGAIRKSSLMCLPVACLNEGLLWKEERSGC